MSNDSDDDLPTVGDGEAGAAGPRWRVIAALAAVVVLVALLVAVIVSRDDDDVATSTSTSTSTTADGGSGDATTSTTADADETTSTAPPATGCTGPAPQMSQPADQGEIVDLDGDGQPDTAWLASPGGSGRELGVLTAAGGGDKVEIDSASPVELTLLVVDADLEPPVELFVSDNRQVQLWTFDDCKLQPVMNDEGEQYTFDLGFRGYGTGVGCADADGDGHRDLVGLNITGNDDTTVDWSRTIIERDGLHASNGATDTGTYQRPADDPQIELLSTVSCGDLTIDADGLRQPQ